jgi:short-subunit dehydrogenase
LRKSQGSILAVGSLAGIVAPPGEAYYAASKHGLRGFLESLRYEVGPQGVRVALVEPGFIRTDLAMNNAETQWTQMPEYDGLRAQLARHWQQAIAGGMLPEAVSRRIVDLIGQRDPPFRTRIGTTAIWVPRLKAVLPERIFFCIVARVFGIGTS